MENKKTSFGKSFVEYLKSVPTRFVNFFKNWGNNFAKNFSSLHNFKEFILNNLLYILILIFIIVCAINNIRFIGIDNIVNVINLSFFYLPIALGIGGIIVLTGTDLSAGRVVGLTSCITASLLQAADYPTKMWPNFNPEALGGWWYFAVLILVMIVGALVGVINGYFVSKFELHPFIVTLGTQLIVYGCSIYYVNMGSNGGNSISGLIPGFQDIITGEMINIFGTSIQWYILYVLILLCIMTFMWNKTKLGKNMYAVGCNPDAARVNGISVMKTTMLIFIIAGAIYGFNGWLSSAYIGSNNAGTGVNFELDAIAACVIGGVSFTGGIGKIRGIVLGVFLLQIINVGFVFLNIPPQLTYIVKGAVILFACAVDMRKYITKR